MRDHVIAWDSCVLIDAIQGTLGRWGAIAPMINLAANGELKIIISTLSVAESYFMRGLASRGATNSDQAAAIESWLENSFLVKRAADFGTCKIAAELCRKTRGSLKPPDAVIIATALRHNADSLLTYDTGVLAFNNMFPTSSLKNNLRICRPEEWTKDNSPQLFDGLPMSDG